MRGTSISSSIDQNCKDKQIKKEEMIKFINAKRGKTIITIAFKYESFDERGPTKVKNIEFLCMFKNF